MGREEPPPTQGGRHRVGREGRVASVPRTGREGRAATSWKEEVGRAAARGWGPTRTGEGGGQRAVRRAEAARGMKEQRGGVWGRWE